MAEVLILGGYGNFGKRIARGLSRHGVPVIIAGRDLVKAQGLAAELTGARALKLDIAQGFEAVLAHEKPAVVVHTCGPFPGRRLQRGARLPGRRRPLCRPGRRP